MSWSACKWQSLSESSHDSSNGSAITPLLIRGLLGAKETSIWQVRTPTRGSNTLLLLPQDWRTSRWCTICSQPGLNPQIAWNVRRIHALFYPMSSTGIASSASFATAVEALRHPSARAGAVTLTLVTAVVLALVVVSQDRTVSYSIYLTHLFLLTRFGMN